MGRVSGGGRGGEAPLTMKVRELLRSHGALFFADLLADTGAFAPELLGALWDLVWAGEVTNDTFVPLRGYLGGAASASGTGARRASRERARAHGRPAFRSRRVGPPGSEGRWSLVARGARARQVSETERRAALARTLLERYGVLTREAVHAEGVPGGFSAVYEVLKAMEEAGRVRRGYFVAGLGATQFALPGADDRLRALREPVAAGEPFTIVLAATDPANPYGAALAWPDRPGDGSAEGAEKTTTARPQRAAGASVVLADGLLVGHLGRGERTLRTFFPETEPERGAAMRALAGALAALVDRGQRRALLLTEIDGEPGLRSALGPALTAAGFTTSSRGWFKRAARRRDGA